MMSPSGKGKGDGATSTRGTFGLRGHGSREFEPEYVAARRMSDGVPATGWQQPYGGSGIDPQVEGVPISVMGVHIGHIQDPRLAILTRRVMKIAFALALLALVDMITTTIADSTRAGISVVMFLLSLSFPVCGLVGARKSNAQLLAWFCSCALFNAALTVVNMTVIILYLASLKQIEEHCKKNDGGCRNVSTGEVYTEEQVSEWVSQLTIILIIHIFVSLGVILLNLFAFFWGNALFQKVRQGSIVVTSAPSYPPTYVYNPQGRVVIGHPAEDGERHNDAKPATELSSPREGDRNGGRRKDVTTLPQRTGMDIMTGQDLADTSNTNDRGGENQDALV